MSKTVVVWIDEPIQSKIVKGIVYATFDCEDVTYVLRGRPSALVGSLRNGAVAYAGFAGKAAADVVRFKPKKAKKRRH